MGLDAHRPFLGFLRDYTGALAMDLLSRGELQGPNYEGIEPDDRDGLLKRLWHNFRKWCKLTGRSAPKGGLLTLTSLGLSSTDKSYPELGSSVKAVAVKSFAVYLSVLANIEPSANEHERIRSTCAWAIAEFIHVTDNAGLILTEQQVSDFSVSYSSNDTSFSVCSIDFTTALERFPKPAPHPILPIGGSGEGEACA